MDTTNFRCNNVHSRSFVLYCYLAIKQSEQRSPSKQREALKDFAEIAVKYIEQRFSDLSSDQKKEAAVRFVIKLFVEHDLPVPDQAIIEAAIEAVVWEINHVGENTGIKQRRDRSTEALGQDTLSAISPPIAQMIYGPQTPDQITALKSIGPDALSAISPELQIISMDLMMAMGVELSETMATMISCQERRRNGVHSQLSCRRSQFRRVVVRWQWRRRNLHGTGARAR